MALYFITEYDQTVHNVGMGYTHPNPKLVWEAQADGHELVAIKNQITGIPFAQNAVQRWFGDDAKFIAANLKL